MREIMMDLVSIRRSFAKLIVSKLAKSKMSPFQLLIMDFINWHSGTSLKDIAEQFKVSMASVSEPIEQLVKSKMVKRKGDDKDRRISRLFVEDKGKKILKKTMDESVKQLFGSFSLKDLKMYHQVLKKISTNLEKNKK